MAKDKKQDWKTRVTGKNMSRREFLKGAGVIVTGIGAAAVLNACAPVTSTVTSTSTTTAAPVTTTATSVSTTTATSTTTQILKSINWRAEFVWNPGDSSRENGWIPTLKAISDASNGQFKVTYYEPNTVVPTAGMLAAASQGTLDMALSAGGYYADTPETMGGVVLGLPTAWTTPQQAYDIYYNKGLLQVLQKMYADAFNVKFFPNSGSGAYGLSTNFPVTSLASFKGKVIRVDNAYAPLINSLGASPVTIAATDIYMALKLGTIDGMGYSFNGFVTQSFGEVIKYAVRPALLCPSVSAYFINMNSWNALGTDLQNLFQTTVQQNFLSTAVYATSLDDKAISDSKIQTVTLSDADAATLRGYGLQIWATQAAKGPISASAIKIIKDYYNMT